MAEVTRRRSGELLRKRFEVLMASPEGVLAKKALAARGRAPAAPDVRSETSASMKRTRC